MKKFKIAVLYNANAGLSTSHAGSHLAVAQIMARPDDIYGTRTLDELPAVMRKIIAKKYDMLVVLGGDGSVQKGITALLNDLEKLSPNTRIPFILVVKMGTMNLVANNVKTARVDAPTFCSRIIAKIRAGEPLDTLDLNPLKVEDLQGTLREYGFLLGGALAVNMLNQYYKKKERGPMRVLEVMQDAFFDELWAALTFSESKQLLTEPVRARIILPGHDPEVCPHRKHTTLMFASVREVGLGCKGMPDAMSRPGHFMLRSSRLKYWEYLVSGPIFWAGGRPPKTFDAVLKNAIVKFDQPTVLTLDGEMLPEMQEIMVSSAPALTFVTG